MPIPAVAEPLSETAPIQEDEPISQPDDDFFQSMDMQENPADDETQEPDPGIFEDMEAVPETSEPVPEPVHEEAKPEKPEERHEPVKEEYQEEEVISTASAFTSFELEEIQRNLKKKITVEPAFDKEKLAAELYNSLYENLYENLRENIKREVLRELEEERKESASSKKGGFFKRH